MSINFYTQSKNSPAIIYIRLRSGRGIDAKAKTKLHTELKDWNIQKQCPDKKSEKGKWLELELSKIKTTVLEAINNKDKNEIITSEWLKEIIDPSVNYGLLPNYLTDYIEHYTKMKLSENQPSSIKKIKVNQNLLNRFESHTGKKYLIKDINSLFQFKFEEYCIGEGYANNTIARCIKFIKSVCNHAKNNGIETHSQLQGLRKKMQEIIRISLTTDEIDRIYKVELNDEYLVNARDWLVISCETGQRVSDFMRFSKEMIRQIDGVNILQFNQIKTSKSMSLPLSKRVLDILYSRNGEFPRKISSQKYNEYIKEVCKRAGIVNLIEGSKKDVDTNRKITGQFEKWELVTSHIGRRSFATNYFGVIPTSLLMFATGHSTEKQFYEYVGKKDTEMAHQLFKYLK